MSNTGYAENHVISSDRRLKKVAVLNLDGIKYCINQDIGPCIYDRGASLD